MIPFPNKKYQVIYADPPWRYEHLAFGSKSRAIESHYPTMLVENIKKIKIPCTENSVLFLWATAPKLKEGIEVMEAWGFHYRTCMIWNKVKMGIGYWFRNQHELLLVGLKGKFSPPKPKERIRSIFVETRGIHSEKPHRIRELIKNWFPETKRLELFARHKADGWDSWGNEELREAYIQDKLI